MSSKIALSDDSIEDLTRIKNHFSQDDRWMKSTISQKHISILLILGMLFVIIASHLPVIFSSQYHKLYDIPTAEKGVLSLSNNPNNKRMVLDGEWEFYWNRLLETDTSLVTEPDLLIHVPDYWSKYRLNGKYLPSNGVASTDSH